MAGKSLRLKFSIPHAFVKSVALAPRFPLAEFVAKLETINVKGFDPEKLGYRSHCSCESVCICLRQDRAQMMRNGFVVTHAVEYVSQWRVLKRSIACMIEFLTLHAYTSATYVLYQVYHAAVTNHSRVECSECHRSLRLCAPKYLISLLLNAPHPVKIGV